MNGLLGATSTGLIAAIGGNDGTSSWSYTTGIFDVERIKINQLAAYYVGSPRVTITAWDGVNQTYSQPIDLVNGKTAQFATSTTNLIQGSRIQIVVSGKATDQLSSLVLDGVGIGGGKNN
jgi:hypothetical protein